MELCYLKSTLYLLEHRGLHYKNCPIRWFMWSSRPEKRDPAKFFKDFDPEKLDSYSEDWLNELLTGEEATELQQHLSQEHFDFVDFELEKYPVPIEKNEYEGTLPLGGNPFGGDIECYLTTLPTGIEYGGFVQVGTEESIEMKWHKQWLKNQLAEFSNS